METKVDSLKPEERTSFSFYIWLVVLVGAMYPMGYYVSRFVLVGTPIINEFISSSVPWGLLVPVYMFFVFSSIGLCMISSFGYVFKIEHYDIISIRAIFLAIVMMLVGLMAIALDLGRLDRGYFPFLVSQNFSSPMLWVMFFYVTYILFAVITFWFLVRQGLAERVHELQGGKRLFYKLLTLARTNASDESRRVDMKLARITGAAAVLSGVIALSTEGSVFGVVLARPFWYGPLMPVFFIISALTSGVAVISFVTIITYKVTRKEITHEVRQAILTYGRVLGILVIIHLFVLAWKMVTSIYHVIPQAQGAETLLLTGPLSLSFWGLEILIGSIFPILILFFPKTRSIWSVLAASVMVIIGLSATRYDIVIAGQVIPALEGLHGFYTPSSMEILILIGLVALSAFIYTVGQKIFPLSTR